jgi:hypothetical protein
MIWTALIRGGALLTFAHGAISLVEKAFAEDVLPHRIYNTVDLARILGMDRLAVLTLVDDRQIKGIKVDGNYRILGSSILEYMKR